MAAFLSPSRQADSISVATSIRADAARNHASQPLIEQFTHDLDMLLSHGDACFWDAEPLFRGLASSTFLTDVLLHELSNLARDDAYIPLGGLTEMDLALVRVERFTLAVRVLEPDAVLSKRLYSRGEHSMVTAIDFPGCGSFAYHHYAQPQPEPVTVLDRTKKLTDLGPKKLVSSEVLRFEAARDVYKGLPVDAPIILLFLLSRPVVRLQWEYDPETLTPVRAVAACPQAARLQFTARMLGEIGDQASLEPLESLLDHQDHFVRWEALRALARLNIDRALPQLEAALDDPHPHIRNAAGTSLQRYQVLQLTGD